MADVFISYSRKDRAFVERLQAALIERDLDAWVDTDDIPPTAEWMPEVQGAIEASDALVFVVSPDSARSEVCRREIEHAVLHSKRIVAVVLRDVDPEEVPETIRALNWIFCRKSDDFDVAVATLDTALHTDLEWVRAHTRLLVRAIEWDANGQDRSFLLRGRDLDAAERWLSEAARHETPEPTPLQSTYLIASRRATVRSTRVRFAALSVALGVAVTLAIVALLQRQTAQHNATVARSRELAARANAALTTDPELSLLLSRESIDVSDTAEAKQALRQALDASDVRATFRSPHRTGVRSAAFSSKGTVVITAQDDGAAQLWALDRPNKAVAALCCHDGPIDSAAISPDDSLAATGSTDGTVRVWDLQDTGRDPLVLSGHEGGVASVAFSPDSTRIVSSGHDGTAKVWGAQQGGEPLVVLTGHSGNVRQAAFDASGTRIVTAGEDGTARVWDAQTGASLRAPFVKATENDLFLSAAFSPNGERVVTGDAEGFADVWDVATGDRLFELRGHGSAVDSAAYSADGSRIVTSGDDGTARIWDAEASLPPLLTLSGHRGTVWTAAFSPKANEVVTAGNDGTTRVWDVRGSDLQNVIRSSTGVCSPVSCIGDAELDSGGNRVVLSTDDGLAKVLDLRHAQEPAVQLRGHEGPVSTATFSADGSKVVTASADGTARVWDAAKGGTAEVVLEGHRAGLTSATIDTAGRRILTTGSDDSARVWDAKTGRLLSTVEPEGNVAVERGAFAADGTRFAIGNSNGTAQIFATLHPDTPVLTLTASTGGVHSVAFSPDGTHLLTAGNDGNARVWDARAKGAPVLTLTGHVGSVFRAVYSQNGERIVTSGADGTVRVWDATTGEPLSVLRSYDGPVPNAGITADGKRVVATDGIARISRCDLCVSTEQLVRLAEVRSTRTLTAAERRLYLHD